VPHLGEAPCYVFLDLKFSREKGAKRIGDDNPTEYDPFTLVAL